MADSFPALADLVKINDQNLADINVTDLLQDAPVLAALAADTASNGTQHKYLKETGAPVVGFRAPNAGLDYSHSSDTLVTIDLKFLDAKTRIDEALVKGQTKSKEELIARYNIRNLRAAFAHAEKQLFYGAANDAAGFVGLADNAGLDGLTDAMVVGAGGAANGAGDTGLTSCWMIRSVGDFSEAAVIMGQDANIEMGETALSEVRDGASKAYLAYVTPISGWIGFQFGSIYSVGRIANIDTDDATTKPLTDALLSQLWGRFPATKKPTHIVMNTKCGGTLQRSRTTYSPTGAEAPWPHEWQGVPIVYTDQLNNDEAAVV